MGNDPSISKQASNAIEELANSDDFHLIRDHETGECFAYFWREDHTEVHQVDSEDFKSYVEHYLFQKIKNMPSRNIMDNSIGALKAKAKFGPLSDNTYSFNQRVGRNGDTLYLFLADKKWNTIEINTNEWNIVQNPPVIFIKTITSAPLPVPTKYTDDVSIHDLMRFIMPSSYEDFILIVSWLLATLRDEGPYPILVLQGEQGSAKSTAARVLKSLIDPSSVGHRFLPRDDRDLMIAAKNSYILSYDNVSKIPDWLSDCFCGLSTGAGFSTRALYTDTDEKLIKASRPIILNGITDFVTRPDLLDRSIIINLPRIDSRKRKTESALWPEFEQAKPKILGALIFAAQYALYNYNKVKIEESPRMADFYRWAIAATDGLPWDAKLFMQAYKNNIGEAKQTALESEPLADLILSLCESESQWSGTATKLLEKLQSLATDKSILPKNAASLSSQLKRIKPALTAYNIDVEFDRSSNARTIKIAKQN